VTRDPRSAPTEADPPGRLDEVYGRRFDDADARRKDAVWREICAYLQQYVPDDGVVLDVACDRGDFIRNIRAGERWASDLRDVSGHLGEGIRFVQEDGLALPRSVPKAYFDVVFMSNYLEHLPSGEHVVEQLGVAGEVLKTGGRLIVLQPNIRLTRGAYWDFIDHKVALTDRSLVEAAELAGFRTEHLVRRFLPYTTKGRLPASATAARLYLSFRPAWRLLGKQTLYVGRSVRPGERA
jgi:ubiquinone/menaquinone biosynthesis C-methylase UbiE